MTFEWRRRTARSNAHLYLDGPRPLCGANVERYETHPIPEHVQLALCCPKCVKRARA